MRSFFPARARLSKRVLGYSLLVFRKNDETLFFMKLKNVFFFRGEFCLNKISIGKLEIHCTFNQH